MERLRPGDPEQIGPWQIVNRLGSGGMGLVYLGTDGTRSAAIKTVREHLLEDPTSRTRLSREVLSLKKVKSKYIAEIVGSDTEASTAWIATSFVDGPSLKKMIEKEGPLKESQWNDLAKGLFQAISAVHKVGIIHRDVKPSNILIASSGPKLIDFGISFSSDSTSLTKTGLVAGTPAWLAPEQFENREVTFAVDNFALGSVLYFAATGSAPWGDEDSSVAHVMRQILTSEPDLRKLNPTQKEIISALLEKDPKKRINASKCLELLGGISETREFSIAKSNEIGKVTEKDPKKTITKIGVASLIAVLILAGIFAFNKQNGKGIAKVSNPQIPITFKWTGAFDGDPQSQFGEGPTYEIYVCDQGILAKSLKAKALSGSQTKGTKLKLINGDSRCGASFDTIVATGSVPESGSSLLEITGKTKVGDAIIYKYEIKRV